MNEKTYLSKNPNDCVKNELRGKPCEVIGKIDHASMMIKCEGQLFTAFPSQIKYGEPLCESDDSKMDDMELLRSIDKKKLGTCLLSFLIIDEDDPHAELKEHFIAAFADDIKLDK